MDVAGKRVLIIGLGTSGDAAARELLKRDAKVVVTESSINAEIEKRAAELRELGADVEIGGHSGQLPAADLAIVSPGIPPDADIVQAMVASGLRIISEIELAYQLADHDIIAVTGTNGKTTTTSLIAAILDRAGVASVAAGNIGLPMIAAMARVPSGGTLVVEVSSFQLAYIESFRPQIAVVLNIAEDHTDWHGSTEEYVAAKARITLNQASEDRLIVNAADDRAAGVARSTAAEVITFSAAGPADASERDGWLEWRGKRIVERNQLSLLGRAGVEDALASLAATVVYGIDATAIADGLRSFDPLPHRLTTVERHRGVTFIDDSKATNPHATLAALAGFSDVVLIAGGRSKGMDLTPLRSAVPPVRAVIALGEAQDDIVEVFGDLVPAERASDMSDAVRRAAMHADVGGSVLLSPACASLDMYGSYAERGDDFARAVRALIEEEGRDGDAQ